MLTPHRNRTLFSNHYLENLIPKALDKIFEIPNFTSNVEPPVIGEGWAKKPDYTEAGLTVYLSAALISYLCEKNK